MNTTTSPSEVSSTLPSLMAPGVPFVLAQGRLINLAPSATRATVWRVQVQAGGVWLTWPGCGDDVFLATGEEVEVPAGVTVLAEVEPRLGHGAARLCLQLGSDRSRTPWSALRESARHLLGIGLPSRALRMQP